jgi:hypothetical protein
MLVYLQALTYVYNTYLEDERIIVMQNSEEYNLNKNTKRIGKLKTLHFFVYYYYYSLN